MNLYLRVIILFFALGSVLFWYKAGLVVILLAGFCGLLLLVLYKLDLELLVLALIALGLSFGNILLHDQNPNSCFLSGSLSGLVEEIPKKAAYNSYRLVLSSPKYGRMQINLKASSSLPFKGDWLILEAENVPIKTSETVYFRAQGLKQKIKVKQIIWVKPPATLKGKFLKFLGEAQLKVTNVHNILLPKEQASLMMAMLIGSQNLSKEIWLIGQNLGVAHLFAASALNLTAIVLFLNYLFKLCKMPRWPKLLLLLGAITFYSLLAGWGPSISRAWFMATLVLSGQFIKRQPNLINILLFSLFISLLIDPNLIGDLGFQFSYLATLGLILWTDKLTNKMNFLPRSLAEPLAITITAQALIFPLQLWYFKNIPLYANLANIVAVPLGSAILILGLLSSFFSVFGSIGWFIASLIETIALSLIDLLFVWLSRLNTFPAADLKLENILWPWIIWLYVLVLYLGFAQKNNLIKHFVIASSFCLLLWGYWTKPNYLTITSISRPWNEALLLQTPQGQKIFICHGSKIEGSQLKKLSIKTIDWWIGDCPKPSDLPIVRFANLRSETNIQINKNLKLKINSAAVLILYKNFSGLILFKPLLPENSKQFYSLIKFAYNKNQSKNTLWSQSPRAQICLTPHLAKNQRMEASYSLKSTCSETFNYLEMKKQKIYTDGELLAFN